MSAPIAARGDVRVEVTDVHRGARHIADPPALAFELRRRLAALEPQRPRLAGPFGAADDVETAAQLLIRQQADGLLTEGAIIAGLHRLEQVVG